MQWAASSDFLSVFFYAAGSMELKEGYITVYEVY